MFSQNVDDLHIHSPAFVSHVREQVFSFSYIFHQLLDRLYSVQYVRPSLLSAVWLRAGKGFLCKTLCNSVTFLYKPRERLEQV